MRILFLPLMAFSVWLQVAHAAENTISHAEKSVLLALKGDPAKGGEAYTLCRGCHRVDAAGKPEAGYPQLAGQHISVIIKQALDIRAGQRDSPKMHPFISIDEVTEQELADIATYLRRLPPVQNGGKGDGRYLAQGKHLYERDCATCHGHAGEGEGARLVPRVAGQHYVYLYRQLRDSRDQIRRNTSQDMVKVIRHYSDDDLRAVSDFMSRLSASGC